MSDEDVPDTDVLSLRAELADMPFEDLQKLQEKIGTKLFKQAMSSSQQGGDDEQDSGKGGRKQGFKRENKNRPMEMSSKKPVKAMQAPAAKTEKVRDPRFDDLSGEYKETFFKRDYAFISGIEQREKGKLEKRLKKEKQPERQQQLQLLVGKMRQKEQVEKTADQRQQEASERRKEERATLAAGKTPYYLKAGERKQKELADKYKALQKSGKLDAYLSKKRKKNASKDRRRLPTASSS